MSIGLETILREYIIRGSASNLDNYSATGNEWKIKSSISPYKSE